MQMYIAGQWQKRSQTIEVSNPGLQSPMHRNTHRQQISR